MTSLQPLGSAIFPTPQRPSTPTTAMETQIWVSIPWLLRLYPFQGDDISSVGHLRRAIWRDVISPQLGASLGSQELTIFDCSLRSLLVPVPIEPRNTLHNRAVHSSRVNGSAGARDRDTVPPGWSELENLHVYLSVDLGSQVQIAEQLYTTLWGKDLNVILEEISNDDGTWIYVPKTHINHLKMRELGYNETRGLLFWPEFDVAFGMLKKDHETARDCGGAVVTGQPGIGKTCFLYYLLFHRLSERKPVAIEQRDFFILFHEGGVYRYPLKADPRYLPDGTWALSDSNDEAAQPCSTFRSASKLRTAWLIQTTPPVETRWRDWRKYCKAGMFVMNHVSIEDITALSKVFNLDVSNIQRLYRKWGPSAQTCLDLLQFRAEAEHEHLVTGAACGFVQDPRKIVNFDFDESKVSHRLFSIRPKGQDRTGRRMQIVEIATDHIKEIISYAAANANANKSSFSRSWLHGISIY
ncbi:hypothetical protein EDB85DRAFT_1959228 [Lactarius pseudohatsudake]|nr:hypothetical protein EDB85DRAFT_1959228 [Lactarius pseudohatsudake]